MDRRQMVTGLGAIAAAAALPSRVAAAVSEAVSDTTQAAGFKATWINQYTYVAPDVEETADWYAEVFGMQRGDATIREIHLWYGDTGGDTLMIVRQANAGEQAGIEKLGFTLEDWDRAAVGAELRGRGLQPISDTDRGFWFRDSEGNEVGAFAEDYLRRPGSASARPQLWTGLSANHVQIIARDHKEMSAWYRDLFGMTQRWEGPTNAYPWVGDSILALNLARDGRRASGDLGRLDHVAYTIADYDHRAVQVELDRRGLEPREDYDLSWNCVDINGLPTQVCDKELVPFAEDILLRQGTPGGNW